MENVKILRYKIGVDFSEPPGFFDVEKNCTLCPGMCTNINVWLEILMLKYIICSWIKAMIKLNETNMTKKLLYWMQKCAKWIK